jgi:hypothetical protein
MANLANFCNSEKSVKLFRIWWTRGDSTPRPPWSARLYQRKSSDPGFPLLLLGGRRQHTVQAQIHCGFGVVVGPSTG